MDAELGPELTRAIDAGGLTPTVRRALLERIDVVVRARETFVDLLDREIESIDAVEAACDRLRSRLRRVRVWEGDQNVTLDTVFDAWDRLDGVAERLDAAAAERQATLAGHRRSVAVVDDDVTDYLYSGRPGLAAITAVGREVADGRRAIVDAIGRAEG